MACEKCAMWSEEKRGVDKEREAGLTQFRATGKGVSGTSLEAADERLFNIDFRTGAPEARNVRLVYLVGGLVT